MADEIEPSTRQYARLVIKGRAVIDFNVFYLDSTGDGRWMSEVLPIGDGGDCSLPLQSESATATCREQPFNGERQEGFVISPAASPAVTGISIPSA